MPQRSKVHKRVLIMANAAAAALVLATVGSVQAQTYTVTNIGSQITGNVYGSVATGINSSDQVVGYYNSASSVPSGYQYAGGELPFVYTPGSGAVTIPNISAYFGTQASAINNAGIVVGDGLVSGDGMSMAEEGFVYNANTGSFTGVAPIAAVSGTDVPNLNLTSINNSGVAVGYSYVNPGYSTYRAVTYNVSSGGTPTDVGSNFSGPVGANGSSSNYGYSINDSGVIAGAGPNTGGAYTSGPTDFFTATAPYATANFTDISTLIAANSNNSYSSADAIEPTPVDAQGNVAGTYTSTLGRIFTFGFLYVASSHTVVSIPGTGMTIVNGIADVGNLIDVVGTTGNQSEGFLYTYSTATNTGTFINESGLASGFTITAITSINSNGDMTAAGTPTGSSYSQALLLVAPPTPEPAFLGFTGLTALALCRRRRRAEIPAACLAAGK